MRYGAALLSHHTPDELRELLTRAGLSQRAAARKLEIDEREFRRMCSGDAEIPEIVFLALQQLAKEKAE